jgi:hypothetical protein
LFTAAAAAAAAVVPHSSMFPKPEHLPIFDSPAITTFFSALSIAFARLLVAAAAATAAVVPHSSIFPYPEHLPTFNSLAIETHLHRIPGLSENFIAMNDDFFFTAPWSLSDFVQEDGSDVRSCSFACNSVRSSSSSC